MNGNIWTDRIEKSPDVLFQVLGEDSVLLNLKSEHYFGLDRVGTRIWNLIAEHGRAEVALQQMLQEFEVTESTLRADFDRLLGELIEAGLIRIVDSIETAS
jgi:hypothetical protein